MNNIAAAPIIKEEIPQASPSIPNAPIVAEESKGSVFTDFQTSKGIPYSATFFGMTKSQFEALKTADIEDTAFKLDAIETHFKEQISNNKYVDSTDTVDQMMKEVLAVLGIKEYETIDSKVEKIFTYINAGRPHLRQFKIKRTTLADTIDQTKNRAMKDLQKVHPNKLRRMGSFTQFMK